MEELEQNVAEVVPAPEETSSNEVQETAQPEEQVVAETPEVETAPEVRQPQVEPVDEMGVPLKNRLAEAQRKLLQREKEIEELRLSKQQQPKEEKYTAEQLRAFVASTDDPQSRVWGLNELDRLSKEEFKTVARNEVQTLQKQQQELQLKQQCFNNVISRNPELAVKDANGNFQGFNPQSPLFNRMNFYMTNPDIASRPEALEIAEAFAMRDLAHATKPVTQQTIAKQANQIKSLQKKTMVEGSGNNSSAEISPRQAAIDKLKQTGKVSDGAVAMGELLRRSGIMSD